jgi:UDP-N-acetyl-D-glucosamine dehydrogenase
VITRLRDVLAEHGRSLRGATVHLMGVSYKPAVADVRESPALEILTACAAAGATVSYTDSYVPEVVLPSGEVLRSMPEGEIEADIVLVHTAHPQEDFTWLAEQELVLDATFRLTGVPHREVV